MDLIKKKYKSIIIISLLLLGLFVTVYLVKNPQIFKSRANADRFQVIDGDGNQVSYENGKFVTTSDHITVGIQKDAVENGFFNP